MTDQGHAERTSGTGDARRLAAYLERYGPGRPLDPERILEIRLRIAAGFYDRPGVRLTAAGRILKTGDVKARGLLPE